MKKLTVYCSILLAFGVLFSAANAQAQIPKPNPGGVKKIVFTDDDFGVHKSKPVLGKPGIVYEVWITTDGVLHCKTNSELKSALIKFTAPTLVSANGGDSTTVGNEVSRKFDLNKSKDGDAYLFNIAPDKYRQKHAVTLYITSASGSKAEIALINKKVPAKIEN